MIPVAVSVPTDIEVEVSMKIEKWAFGKIVGKAVQAH